MTESVLVHSSSEANGVVELRWHRPRAANAFDEALADELLEAVRAAATDRTRVLALRGEGGRFSAGFDLGGDLDDRALAWRFARAEQLLATVRRFRAITVACVSGPAHGMGADLVASCDYRLGDSRAQFRFPGARFGVALGTEQLRARVGTVRAMDVLLRNEVLDADTALRDGLLTNVLGTVEQKNFVTTLAQDCRGLDGITLRHLLEILRGGDDDASLAHLTRSVLRDGLASRIEKYRSAALRRTVPPDSR